VGGVTQPLGGEAGTIPGCKSFLSGFPPVSVKMVKEQKFPLMPERSAGICGRLKCCLAYETGTGVSRKAHCGGSCPSSADAGDARSEYRISGS
jgi:hypothetical protein